MRKLSCDEQKCARFIFLRVSAIRTTLISLVALKVSESAGQIIHRAQPFLKVKLFEWVEALHNSHDNLSITLAKPETEKVSK